MKLLYTEKNFKERVFLLLSATVLCCVLAFCMSGCLGDKILVGSSWPTLTLEPTDRILILAPHPDDEILGCGGIIRHATEMQLPLRVVFLTHGDSNEWSFLVYRKHPTLTPNMALKMGWMRSQEALAASKLLGLFADQLIFLGYPDFGTLKIWHTHWRDRPPLRGRLTRVTSVPYDNVFRKNAPYKGEEILKDLKTVIHDFKPTKVFVSHPADLNPDHRALYLFTRIALWDLEHKMKPKLYPYLIHFKKWPTPKGYRPANTLFPPQFPLGPVFWRTYPLNNEDIVQKKQALMDHKTQFKYSAPFLLSFVRKNELFGDFQTLVLSEKEFSSNVWREGENLELWKEIPDELIDAERSLFVGLGWDFIKLEDGHLILSLHFSKPLTETVEASLYVFGYRHDRNFSHMPKLRIRLTEFGYNVYDQDHKLSQGAVTLTRKPKQVVIQIPLKLLGDPQRILTSARTYFGEIPFGWTPWRTLAVF